nr:putative reverse transcriptase domain-containing protein [Tanacetum cinerariifolium]
IEIVYGRHTYMVWHWGVARRPIKTSSFCSSIAPAKEVARALDIIRRPSFDVKLFGGAASRDIDFISGLTMRRAVNPVQMEEATLFFDKELRGSIENMMDMDDDYIYALNCLRDTISSFDFSCFMNKDTAPSIPQQILASALFSEMVKDMEVHFDMTVRQITVFEYLRAPHAQDFLLAIPISGLGQHISSVEYRTIFKYRLMIPLFLVDEICPVCHKVCSDSFGEHAVYSKQISGFNYRNNMVRDVLFDICRRAGISGQKEAPVNFMTDPLDGRSTLRHLTF